MPGLLPEPRPSLQKYYKWKGVNPVRNVDWRQFYRKEDWLSVWLATIVILVSSTGLISTVPKIAKWEALPVLPGGILIIGVGVLLLFLWPVKMLDESVRDYSRAFPVIFAFAILAEVIGRQAAMSHYGFGAVLWALVIGLVISNTVSTPAWLKPAVKTELYIKTGLVLMGAEILFGRLAALGKYGIGVAAVTPVVLYLMYLFGTKVLKMTSKPLVVTIASATSVCGVSAAIAAGGASKARREEITMAISITLIFTALMMVLMPAFITLVGIEPAVGGAWIGGTIDSTGAVAAAGAVLGTTAMEVAVVIKMIQNTLIGFLAFIIALIWVVKVERNPGAPRPRLSEIWTRTPKFVVGFLVASLVFSFLLSGERSSGILSITRPLKDWFFILAFVSIGLESRFADLKKMLKGGKPVTLYIVGQSFNLILTFIMAYLLFSGF